MVSELQTCPVCGKAVRRRVSKWCFAVSVHNTRSNVDPREFWCGIWSSRNRCSSRLVTGSPAGWYRLAALSTGGYPCQKDPRPSDLTRRDFHIGYPGGDIRCRHFFIFFLSKFWVLLPVLLSESPKMASCTSCFAVFSYRWSVSHWLGSPQTPAAVFAFSLRLIFCCFPRTSGVASAWHVHTDGCKSNVHTNSKVSLQNAGVPYGDLSDVRVCWVHSFLCQRLSAALKSVLFDSSMQ